MTVLVVCLVSAAYMAGLAWFVGAVHYPLFAGVGPGGWADYHRRHSSRTTWVVLPAMATELVTAGWLILDRPAALSPAAGWAGLALAAGTWVLTALAASTHGTLGDRLDPARHRRLLTVHHARTALWTAHAVLLAAAASSGG